MILNFLKNKIKTLIVLYLDKINFLNNEAVLIGKNYEKNSIIKYF